MTDSRLHTTDDKQQTPTTTIVLWDIDNTLLHTGGAGSLGMTRAFRDLYGIDDAFGRVEFSGRTDTAIFRDAALAHGIAATPASLAGEMTRFADAYIPQLERALAEVNGGRLMPGVGEILQRLDTRADVVQGLGTGNFRRGSALKLRHFAIDRFFPGCIGGFGEDSELRDEVIRVGIERLRNGSGGSPRVVIIGDTPHDIAAAKANGARSIGVATGRDSAAGLLACGADIALDDLSDVERVIGLICGV